MSDIIPLFRPSCGDEEIEAVARVMRSGWWGMGPETEKFEEEFAAYTGARHAVAVNSGTMALELAARALNISGQIVIVPALTFASTGQAMQHAGNTVDFADISEDTLCLSAQAVRDRLAAWGPHLTPQAVVPVWYAGLVDTIDYPMTVKVIEDCAHAAGSSWAGDHTASHAAAWSFQAVKNLATGDGGMITTNDEYVAREARRLRWCGIDKSTWDRDKDSRVGYGWDYDIPGDGEKAHMNDITAAIGRVQLRHLDERNDNRRFLARCYNNHFEKLSWLRTPVVSPDASCHLYAVRVPAQDRQRFIQHCIERGVSAGVHYKPLTHYPQFNGSKRYGGPPPDVEPAHLPVTNRVWKTLVTLPLYPDMALGDFHTVTETVKAFHPSKGAEL